VPGAGAAGIGGLLEFVLTTCHTGEWLGYLGSWAIRLLTMNRCQLDPESWNAMAVGFVVLVALSIIWGVWLR